jgi:hypothetical protein
MVTTQTHPKELNDSCPFSGYNNVRIVARRLERNVDYDKLTQTHELLDQNESFEMWLDISTKEVRQLGIELGVMSGDAIIVRKTLKKYDENDQRFD